jgi:hypothetical protein
MTHFIITAIVALAAAKADSQIKDNTTPRLCLERSERENAVAKLKAGPEKEHFSAKR